MALKNRKCLCCSTSYSYCPDCSRVDALKESWYVEFCSSECKDLWKTLTRFGMGRLTKSEAKETISNLNLKPIESYVACVQRDYKKVMVEEKKPKKTHRKIEQLAQIIEPVVVVEEPVIQLEEPVVQEHEVVLVEE